MFHLLSQCPCSILSGGLYDQGLFPVLPLGSQDWPLCFTKPKMTMEKAMVDPGGWRGGQKPWGGHYCLVQGSWGQWERLSRLPLIPRSHLSLGVLYHGQASQRQWADAHAFQWLIPNSATVWSLQDDSGGYTVCAPHPVLGFWSELLWICWRLLPFYPIRVNSKTRVSHPHMNLLKLSPSSPWSHGEPRA